MSGDLDYLIREHVADIEDYDRLYQKLTDSVSLADVTSSFVMEEITNTTALPVWKDTQCRSITSFCSSQF